MNLKNLAAQGYHMEETMIDGMPYDLWLEKVSYELCKEEYEAIVRKRQQWLNPPKVDAAEIGVLLLLLIASPFIVIYALITGELP